jgi:chemotaxis protein MotB
VAIHRSLPLILAFGIGCVPIQKYRDLETSLADAGTTITERDGQISDLERELASSQRTVSDLEAQLQQMQEAYERKKKALEAAQTKEAELMASKGQLEADVESMKQALAELEARREAAEKRLAAYRDLLERFQSLIDAGKLKVKIQNGRMVVELASDVLFASGSAELSPEGQAAIEEVSGVLAGIPGRTFQVEGHTDDDPIATPQYPSNWELASGRALTVVKTMVSAGMPPERISASSYALFQPVASNDSDEGKASNRRIEIVVMPDLSALPGYDELQQIGGDGPAPRPGKKPGRKRGAKD